MLSIVTIPTPSLRIRSTEVDRDVLYTKETQAFIDAIIPAMYDDDGIGLAAPQVGNNIRVCVIGKEAINMTERPRFSKKITVADDLILVNPVWTKLSRKTNWDIEGCLSVPKVYGDVERYTDIAVKAIDRHGKEIEFEAHKFFARVVQHEVDHLDGILFIDRAKDIHSIDDEYARERLSLVHAERNVL